MNQTYREQSRAARADMPAFIAKCEATLAEAQVLGDARTIQFAEKAVRVARQGTFIANAIACESIARNHINQAKFAAQQYAAAANDALVTADDIRQDASFYANEAYAEDNLFPNGQCDVCGCGLPDCDCAREEDSNAAKMLAHTEACLVACERSPECTPAERRQLHEQVRMAKRPAWNPRLAAAAARIVTAAGGLALALCLTGTPTSAHEYPIIGTPAYDATCSIVREWEDGGAQAYCTEDGETYIFDADGQPYQNAADVPVRGPGWYVAPELLQIGPNAR